MTTLRSPFRRPAQARLVRAEAGTVELLLYDEIGYWGIRAKEFAQALAEIDADEIHLRINSPGGDVFDGVAMFNSLRQHPARVVTHIDGLAASIASLIALAGDEVRIAPNAFFMIHNPWTITVGNAGEHRKAAETLEKITAGSFLSTYQAKTGLDREVIETWMDEETWLDAAESRDAGFADVVEEAAPADALAEAAATLVALESRLAAYNVSGFQHVPAALRDGAQPSEPRVREAERHLREAGFSRRAAKAGAAAALQASDDQRDVGDSSRIPPGSRDGAGADYRRADPAAEALAAADALAARMVSGALNRR